jgi:hypothetical protein
MTVSTGSPESTRPDIEGIRKRCEAATAGPWYDGECSTKDCWCRWVGTSPGRDEEQSVVLHTGCAKANDAIFISHARSDIPELLSLISSLESRVADLEEDAARMDWLEANTGEFETIETAFIFGGEKTLREVIDQARAVKQ